jgi:hypothetical protein
VLYDATTKSCARFSVDTLTPAVTLLPAAAAKHYVENGCISNPQRFALT